MAGVDELFPRAVASQRKGDLVAAEREYREILSVNPQHALSLSNLGVILGRRGELVEAINAAENATRADPNLAVAHFNLGNIYRHVNRPADAVKAYERMLLLTPGFAPGHLNLGIAVSELGDWPAAIGQFRKALELQPGIADGLFHLGEALIHAGQFEQAITALRAALNQSPNLPRNYLALARALAEAGQVDQAILMVEQALGLQPQHAVAHNYLGILLEKAGRSDEAQPHFRAAIGIRPDFAGAWSNLGLNLSGQGRSSEAAEAFAKSLELRPDPTIASCRLVALLDSSSIKPWDLLREHLNWAAQYAAGLLQSASARVPIQPGQRIKIGYLLGEFKTSALPNFLETLLRHHDRGKFHITCYADTTQSGEAMDRLRNLTDVWHSLVGNDDAGAIERIRADEIDVLVDLNGHTAGNRLLIFARKPARVNVSLFGYPATTGLKAIDFRISDCLADPRGDAEAISVEKIVRLPEVGRLYVPPAAAPLPSALPVASQETITFGCLSRPGKLSDLCLETWAKILHSLSHSRLVLQAGRSMETARHLTNRLMQLGVDPDRITLLFTLPEQDYFQAYQSIDLALDPFPFNAWTTTCDALWMGVPVVSMAGNDCRSRQGLSILSNIGLADFVADTPEKFVKLSAIWANQTDTLAELRANLRGMMMQSPLTDAAGYVRYLEEAYLSAICS